MESFEKGKALVVAINDLMGQASDLDANIDLLRHRLNSARSKGKSTGESEAYVGVLEKRLNHSVIKFNELVAVNTTLRDSVDTLRREKVNFGKIEKRLIADIEKEKAAISELIEKVNANYATKDKSISDLQHMRSIADREHFEFEREWKELNRLISNDSKLHQFLQEKELSVPVPSPVNDHTVNTHDCMGPTPDGGEEDPNAALEELEAEIRKYEEIFEKIKESVGICGISELIEFFNTKEMFNYSLFNHSNLIAGEIERLHFVLDTGTRELQQALGGVDPKHRSNRRLMDDRSSAGPTLADQIEINLDANRQLAHKVGAKAKLMHKICNSIQSVHDKLMGLAVVSDTASGKTLLMDTVHVDEENIAQFFSRIESQLNILLRKLRVPLHPSPGQLGGERRSSVYVRGLTVNTTRRSAVGSRTKRSNSVGCLTALPSSIALTETELDSGSDGGDRHPLTRAEIESRLRRLPPVIAEKKIDKIKGRVNSAASTRPGTSSTTTTGIRRHRTNLLKLGF